MKLSRAAIFAAAIAIPAGLAAVPPPAHAENLLDNLQGLVNGNRGGDQNAYERGRQEQAYRDQRDREREHHWDRDRHEIGPRDYGYSDRDRDRGFNRPDRGEYAQGYDYRDYDRR